MQCKPDQTRTRPSQRRPADDDGLGVGEVRMSGKVWDGLQKEREAVPERVVILDTTSEWYGNQVDGYIVQSNMGTGGRLREKPRK